MKIKAKRIVSAICALAMCAAMVPAMAFAEGSADVSSSETTVEDNVYDNPDEDIFVKVGDEIVLQGGAGTGHSWKISTGDTKGLQFIGDTNGQSVTVKVLETGTYRVQHKHTKEGNFLPTFDYFDVIVPDTAFASEIPFYAAVSAMPYGDDGELVASTELTFELEYFGDQIISMTDPNFEPVQYTAEVTSANESVPIQLATSEEDKPLEAGFYRLRYAGDSEEWDGKSKKTLYCEVTENGEFKIVSQSGTTITSGIENYNTITLEPTLYNVGYRKGSNEAVGTPPEKVGYQYNQMVTIAENTDLTCEGYVFAGWYAMVSGERVDYQAGESIQVTGDIVLFANWTEEPTEPEEPENPGTDPEEPTNPGEAGKIEINKTATDLVEDQTDVSLTIGATEGKEKVAVMFLLDKSTSQGMRDEAAEMLDELSEKLNTDILYDVVIFSGTAKSTGWQDIQDTDTLDVIKDNFVNGETTSGTNMDAGIEKATADMSTLPADFANATTYLITLSDGITYVWTGEDGNVKCVPVQGIGANGNIETTAQTGTDTWSMFYAYGTDLASIYAPEAPEQDITTVMNAFKTFVEPKMETTQAEGHVQDYYGENSTQKPISTYIYDDEKTAKVAAKYACGPDFALYESATGYEELVAQFDYSYAYAVPEANTDGTDNNGNWDNFPWGRELMEYFQSLSTNKNEPVDVSNADAEKIFSTIKDEILYEIASGTVTDVIGNDFDLAGVESFKLTVGGVEMTGTVDENDENTVTFDGGNYTVTYQSGENEQFTWTINTPVESANPVQLTYTLKLVNKNTEVGDYTVPTNEEAEIKYTSSNGGTGTEEFPVPKVTYTVNQPVIPISPLPGIGDLNDLLDVQVLCTNKQVSHNPMNFADLLDGSYQVVGNADGSATVTVSKEKYIDSYNQNSNTGVTHTATASCPDVYQYTVVYNADSETWSFKDDTAASKTLYFQVQCETPATVTVTATATPAPDEHPDIAEGIANGTWGGAPTATPAQTMSVPQTSDDLPLGALILVAVVAAGAVCGLVVLRKRGEQ